MSSVLVHGIFLKLVGKPDLQVVICLIVVYLCYKNASFCNNSRGLCGGFSEAKVYRRVEAAMSRPSCY